MINVILNLLDPGIVVDVVSSGPPVFQSFVHERFCAFMRIEQLRMMPETAPPAMFPVSNIGKRADSWVLIYGDNTKAH